MESKSLSGHLRVVLQTACNCFASAERIAVHQQGKQKHDALSLQTALRQVSDKRARDADAPLRQMGVMVTGVSHG